MTARIYKPSKTAMQSGQANTQKWVLDFAPEEPRQVEPLMGWTSSGDMRQQVRLRFASKEEAVAYCERHGIVYEVFDTKPGARRRISYSDNFAFNRRDAWTHGSQQVVLGEAEAAMILSPIRREAYASCSGAARRAARLCARVSSDRPGIGPFAQGRSG